MKDWRNLKEWWKAPILQGEENDYGIYDYFVEEIPESYCRWEFSKIAWEDDQGHPSHLRKVWCNYFRTMDGYDSCSGSDCWRCVLRDTIKLIPRRIKRKINKKKREIEDFLEFFQICHKHLGFKESVKKARRWSKEFIKQY